MITINCLTCGKEFRVFPYEVKRGTKFCSVECYYKSSIKHQTWEEKYGVERSKKMKINLSEMRKGELNPFYGGHHTEEFKRQKSEAYKDRLFSKETRKKISEAKKGEKKSEECKAKLRALYLDKTYEELHGIEMANQIKAKQSKASEGSSNPMYGMRKEQSPNWQGGISFEPYTYDFNDRFKEIIRKRDNYCCIICNKLQEDYLLHVHHIDYDKTNSFPQNCVSLCRGCHGRTGINRQHWKGFFQSVLKERYGYEYTPDQKLILDFMGGNNG